MFPYYLSMKKFIAFLALFLISGGLLTQAADREVKIISLGGIDFATAQAISQDLLSPDGRMVYISSQRAVLINDYPDNVAAIEALLGQVTAATPNIRITLSFAGQQRTQSHGFGISGAPWQVRTGSGRAGWPRVEEFELNAQRTDAFRNTAMTLMTLSGNTATIWVGREEPEWRVVEAFISRPDIVLTRNGQPFIWQAYERTIQRVGAEMMIQPRLLANGLVEVNVFPRVTYRTPEGSEHLDVETLKTTVIVAPGRDVPIGQNIREHSERLRSLFGPAFFTDASHRSLLDITVRAEVVR